MFRLCKYIFADQIFSFYSAHIYSFAVHCSWCSLIVLFFSDYFLPQKTNKKSWFLREITFFCETLLLSSNVFLETDQRSFTAAALKIWNVFSYCMDYHKKEENFDKLIKKLLKTFYFIEAYSRWCKLSEVLLFSIL